MKDFLVSMSYRIAPDFTRQVSEAYYLNRRIMSQKKKAVKFRDDLNRLATLEEKVDISLAAPSYGAMQKRPEILGLLKLIQEHQIKTICEIGTGNGGTLALLCQVLGDDADILVIDIALTEENRAAISSFTNRNQRITCVVGDSTSKAVIQQAETWLNGRKLDFLFIDGDHSYSGVKSDYENFSPFVGQGKWIGFHDIVPDYRVRYGQETDSDSGEVYAFWRVLKEANDQAIEFVEAKDQDGYGIGVLLKP